MRGWGRSGSTAAASACERFPDLGATVHCAEAPEELAEELPERYSSCFSVVEYFDLYDRPSQMCAVELDDPHHVVLFTVKGRTADVLNRVIDIEPEAVHRAEEAIFRAFPGVKRVRAEIKFPPEELRGPARVTLRNDDLVIDLPATVAEYRASLGKRTRQNINQYTNRLGRAHPDFHLVRFERDEISFELVEKVAQWNTVRMRRRGLVSSFEAQPATMGPLWSLLQRYGLALCGYIGDQCVAAQLVLCVGRDTWVHTVSFDSRYEDMHLGLLMAYFTVVESIERACSRVHMLWGTPVYKQRLGAKPVPAYQVSLFRARSYKILFAREKWHKDELNRIYWRTRHGVKRTVVGIAGVVRGSQPDDQRPA